MTYGNQIGAALQREENARLAAARKHAWCAGWRQWVRFADRSAPNISHRRSWLAGWDAAACANETGGTRPVGAEAEAEWERRADYAKLGTLAKKNVRGAK